MNNAVLKKVDINDLMDTMMDLWRRGVDYVDIEIKADSNSLMLMFTEEYLSDDAREKLNEIEESTEIKGELTDEDLNQLL